MNKYPYILDTLHRGRRETLITWIAGVASALVMVLMSAVVGPL